MPVILSTSHLPVHRGMDLYKWQKLQWNDIPTRNPTAQSDTEVNSTEFNEVSSQVHVRL